MTVLELRYLASLRERVGTAAESLPVPEEGVAFEQLIVLLEARHGAEVMAALTDSSVRLALNRELVATDGLRLCPGDELAFLPPVTGG